MKYYIAIMLAVSHPIWAETSPYQEIADEANLPILNPDLSTRKTAKIRLSNGLEAYIISDANADQSAAALAVNAGSWMDSDEYPGMAHFCEHMLFRGSQKFPNENEFSALVADNNGQANAFTANDRTVYMFSSCDEGFLSLLEHFSRFFIDPLFNPAGISSEMHAVDQEFAKNFENDDWREYMVFKETGNPDHPNARFSIGNSETLQSIPQSALKKWHAQYYAASKMHLVLYSSLSLETLKETVRSYFSQVPNHETPSIDNSQPITSTKQKGHFIYIQPIKQNRTLTLSWELPRDLSLDPTKSAQLFCYALKRGQPYSLENALMRENLIDDLEVRVDELGDNAHRFFQIEIDLTARGLEQIDTVIMRCFQAIHGLQTSGIPAYLFEEMNEIAQLNYQFQPRQDAFQYIYSLGASLCDEPLSTYPKEKVLATEHSPRQVARIGSLLTPENCLYFLQADFKNSKIVLDRRERWIQAEYALKEIPSEWLKTWLDAEAHPDIRLAGPNPFIPGHFDLVSENSPRTLVPLLIAEDDSGIAYYSRIAEFRTPESAFYLHFLSPEINSSSRSTCLSFLYLDYLTDRLHPTLGAASSAGLQSSFTLDRNRIQLKIVGFSDKAPLLLQEILKQMAAAPPTPDQFDILKTRFAIDLSNHTKDLAVIQAKEIVASLLYQDKPTKHQQLLALQTITYDDFCAYLHSLFEKSYTQAMFAGNLSLKEAESAWLDVRNLLDSAPWPKSEHPETKILTLSDGQGPFAIHEKSDVLGNAAFLIVDVGNFTFERRAAQEILSQVLKESFFHTLRTQQKTGYIAQSDQQEIDLHLFQYFLVQSNSHQPEDLLYRFELFLESTLQDLSENIPKSRFVTLKQNLAESLLTRFRSLKEKSSLWNQLAFDNGADFAWIEKRLAGYASITYETFLKEANSFLSRNNHKRLAVLFEGEIPAPFTYQPISADKIGQIGKYSARSEIALQLEEEKSN